MIVMIKQAVQIMYVEEYMYVLCNITFLHFHVINDTVWGYRGLNTSIANVIILQLWM